MTYEGLAPFGAVASNPCHECFGFLFRDDAPHKERDWIFVRESPTDAIGGKLQVADSSFHCAAGQAMFPLRPLLRCWTLARPEFGGHKAVGGGSSGCVARLLRPWLENSSASIHPSCCHRPTRCDGSCSCYAAHE